MGIISNIFKRRKARAIYAERERVIQAWEANEARKARKDTRTQHQLEKRAYKLTHEALGLRI